MLPLETIQVWKNMIVSEKNPHQNKRVHYLLVIVKSKLSAYFQYDSFKSAYSPLFSKAFINGRPVSNILIEYTIVVRTSNLATWIDTTTDFGIQLSIDLISKDVFQVSTSKQDLAHKTNAIKFSKKTRNHLTYLITISVQV